LAASLAGAGPVMTVAGHSYPVPPAAFEGGGGKRGRAEAFLLHITWPGLKGLAFVDLFEPSEQLDSFLVLAINGRNDGGRMTTDEQAAFLRRSIRQAAGAALEGDPCRPRRVFPCQRGEARSRTRAAWLNSSRSAAAQTG
jgi:hypothetical protein